MKALEILRELTKDAPEESRFRQEEARTANNVSVFLQKISRHTEAWSLNQDALTLLRDLIAKAPANHELQSLLGITLENRGWIWLNEDEKTGVVPVAVMKGHRPRRDSLVETRKHLKEAVVRQQSALKIVPGSPICLGYLRSAFKNLAETSLRLDDHDGAARAAEELPGHFPPGAHEKDRANEYHQAACFLDRCATLALKDDELPVAKRKDLSIYYRGRTVALLREAVDRGYGKEKLTEAFQQLLAESPARPE